MFINPSMFNPNSQRRLKSIYPPVDSLKSMFFSLSFSSESSLIFLSAGDSFTMAMFLTHLALSAYLSVFKDSS